MMLAGAHDFGDVLIGFPEAVRPLLSKLPHQTGRLEGADVAALCEILKHTPQTLALALLPLAQSFARPEISGFRVGAVAVSGRGKMRARPQVEKTVLFLGANMEFRGLPLHHTVHAEQAAVLNAWQAGGDYIQALAVSAPPCGACRQFLMESAGKRDLAILLPSAKSDCRQTNLTDLLPEAFGPGDLSRDSSLFEQKPMGPNPICVKAPAPPEDSNHSMRHIAERAAQQCYAPYTKNLAGCALRLSSGDVVAGGSLESAAYNPGLTALQTALTLANLGGARLPDDIEIAVLAERPTTAGQMAAAELMLSTWAPRAEFITHRF